ncbi:hypothetical protein CMQ_163 [Grosmannia clavigera kw1407]|uniref:Tho complex subunit 7 mft1p n=1 Tax=Grosmannia clavigera (strain kw1407 / UAMH 11150) TaxID=655863 RepID=F0XRJ0_GROCL|nr:uncharacterized protein CMQ_163 [Grosmannia clavigera kw1407]EFW99845.1 hypothetical protein CMQ_163 [Grosmannia clavigera kw1407]
MASYQLLDVKEEEELYRTRLLNVEEKPFKRITKRLSTLRDVVAVSCVRQEQTPPPEVGPGAEADGSPKADKADASAEDGTDGAAVLAAEIEQLREDVTLDFAAFDASVARLQFLHQANGRERERYDADRGSIADTCQAVRDNMAVLRVQLDRARATLAQRKLFDDMADRITSSRTLRPRPDQQASIAKLEDECRQLERDGDAYAETWRERRLQFSRIMDESMRLRRLIRDEKEEVERREGMDDEDGGSGSNSNGKSATLPTGSSATAPAAPASVAGDSQPTPQPPTLSSALEGQTPATTLDSPAPDYDGGLRPGSGGGAGGGDNGSSFSRSGSRLGSRAASREVTPNPATAAAEEGDNEADGSDDVDMVEAGETTEAGEVDAADASQLLTAADTPMITTAAASPTDDGEVMDTT